MVVSLNAYSKIFAPDFFKIVIRIVLQPTLQCKKIYCLVTWFATVWQLKVKVKPFYTMFPSYQIAMAPFQFLYQIGLLFPLEHIFFSMILLTERGCNASILKVIQDVSDQIAIDSLQKPNGNTSGTIIGYDFEFIWKQKTYEIINEIFLMKV